MSIKKPVTFLAQRAPAVLFDSHACVAWREQTQLQATQTGTVQHLDPGWNSTTGGPAAQGESRFFFLTDEKRFCYPIRRFRGRSLIRTARWPAAKGRKT